MQLLLVYLPSALCCCCCCFPRRGTGKHKWGGLGGGVYLTLQLLLVDLPSAGFVLFLRRGSGKDKWCVYVCVCVGGGGGTMSNTAAVGRFT